MEKRPKKTGRKDARPRSGTPARTAPAVAEAPEPVHHPVSGRMAAAQVRLGMTPPEVRACAGQPECILFGSEDHVEWQFGVRGVDPVGAPTLYVTTLTFAAGRVVRITERTADAS